MSFFINIMGSGSAPNDFWFPKTDVYMNDTSVRRAVITQQATATELQNVTPDTGKGNYLRCYVRPISISPLQVGIITHRYGDQYWVSVDPVLNTLIFSSSLTAEATFGIHSFSLYDNIVHFYNAVSASYVTLKYSPIMGISVLGIADDFSTLSGMLLSSDLGTGCVMPDKKYYIVTSDGRRLATDKWGGFNYATAKDGYAEWTFDIVPNFPVNTYGVRTALGYFIGLTWNGAFDDVDDLGPWEQWSLVPCPTWKGRFMFISQPPIPGTIYIFPPTRIIYNPSTNDVLSEPVDGLFPLNCTFALEPKYANS